MMSQVKMSKVVRIVDLETFMKFAKTMMTPIFQDELVQYKIQILLKYSRTRIIRTPWETKKVRTNRGTSYPYA